MSLVRLPQELSLQALQGSQPGLPAGQPGLLRLAPWAGHLGHCGGQCSQSLLALDGCELPCCGRAATWPGRRGTVLQLQVLLVLLRPVQAVSASCGAARVLLRHWQCVLGRCPGGAINS